VADGQSSTYCQTSTIADTFIEWTPGSNLGNISPSSCGFYCKKAQTLAPIYEVIPAGCDPEAGTCTLRARVPVEMEGLHQEFTLFAPAQIYWFGSGTPTVPCNPPGTPGAGCNPPLISSCGLFGAGIDEDQGEASIQLSNLSCDTLSGSRFRKYSLSVYRCKGATGCEQRTDVFDLDLTAMQVGRELGCPEPPPEDCNTGNCQTCITCGTDGSSGSGGGGGGSGWGGEGSGPGAQLFYLAGGPGHDGFPGTAAWRPELGLYWSHDYAERIVVDPDDSHVWMITKGGSFREFSNLSGGVYQTVAPTDEYRTLRRTGGGWTLTSLDGTVQAFNGAGRWTSTTDRFGNAKTALYNGMGQLETVMFPDARSETFTYYPSGKLASITETGVGGGASRTWDYTWGTTMADEHFLRFIDLPDGMVYELTYGDVNLPGYLTLVELVGTSGGRRVVSGFEYDAQGNTTALWRGDALSTGPNAVDVWTLSYDNPILPVVTTVTDPLGDQSVYTLGRDSNSRKARLERLNGSCPTCGNGPNSELVYNDPAHPLRPTRQTDAGGDHTDFTYDSHGQVLTRTEAASTTLERTTTWTYDPTYPALVATIEEPSVVGGASLRTTTLTYNSVGALTGRRIEGVEDPGGAFLYDTIYTPSPEGQNLTIDPPGYGMDDLTTFTYDPARGDLLVDTRTDPIVGITTFGYDPYNRRESVTDPNGVSTTTVYDSLNRVTSITQEGALPAEDLVTTHEYTEHGDLLRTTLPKGNVIEYGYDPIGRLVSIERRTDALTPGDKTVYTLDAIGNRVREDLQRWTGTTYETRSFTEYEYSTRCQLDAVLHPGGRKTEYAYDCEGNLDRVWDPANPSLKQTAVPTTQYTYDGLDRLTQVSQQWGGDPERGAFADTSYGYDMQDHLTSVTDAEMNTTTYIYSDRDLLTQETSPVSGVTSHLYNEHGELTETTDARAITMIRALDALDRVTLMDYPGDDLDVTYTYDDVAVPFSIGRLTAITRDGASIGYEYDRFGRQTQDGDLGYTYDKNGNRKNIVYPGGVTAAYGFDFADRPESLTVERTGHPDQVVASGALYEPSGPLGDLQLGNGLAENRGWTNRYFPQDIQVNGLATVLLWIYTTDFVGNPTDIVDDQNAANNRTYEYQPHQYFLTEGNGPWGDQGWEYDKIGNRLKETKGGIEDIYTYTLNGAGKNTALLDLITLGATGTRDYHYGPAGHLERVTNPGNQILYTTDAAGRLSRLDRAAGDSAADFTYDGRSFLTSSNAGHVTEVFTDGFESGDARCWDGEFNATLNAGTADCDPQPKTTPIYSSDGLLHAVTHRPDKFTQSTRYYLYFAGRPIAQLDIPSAGGVASYLWLTTDHLGTPILATDDARVAVWQGGFEPFGQDWSGASLAGIDLRFPGQWMDESWQDASEGARSYYNVHRWYEAGVGRYGRVDPVVSLKALFHFLYPQNPISGIDPSGLCMKQQAIQVPGGPLRLINVPCDSKARKCGTSLDDPSFRKLDKPCIRDCDRSTVAKAARRAGRQANSACGNLESDAPFRDGAGGQRRGWIDPDSGSAWVLPTGDKCVDYCICAHETLHLRQVILDRARGYRTSVHQKECAAYDFSRSCLQRILRSGT